MEGFSIKNVVFLKRNLFSSKEVNKDIDVTESQQDNDETRKPHPLPKNYEENTHQLKTLDHLGMGNEATL